MSQADMLSINAVAAKLGLSVHQLRRWELMFGLEIKRGRGQQRQYRSEDMSVLERIKELVEQGWPTSQIRPQLEAEGLVTPKLIGLPPPPGNPEVLSEALIGFRNFTERRFIEISRQIDELRQLLISITLKQELQGEPSSPWQPVQREFAPEPKAAPPQEISIGPDFSAGPPVEFTPPPPPPPPQRTSIIGAPAVPKESTFEVGPSSSSFTTPGSGLTTPAGAPERRSIIGEPNAPPPAPPAPTAGTMGMSEEEADALLDDEDFEDDIAEEQESAGSGAPATAETTADTPSPSSPSTSEESLPSEEDDEEEDDEVTAAPTPTITPVSSSTAPATTSGTFSPVSPSASEIAPAIPAPPADPFKSSPFLSAPTGLSEPPAPPKPPEFPAAEPPKPVEPASASSFAPTTAPLTPSTASDMFSSVIQSVNDATARESAMEPPKPPEPIFSPEPSPAPPAPPPPPPPPPPPVPGPAGTPFTPPAAESSPFIPTPAPSSSSPFLTPPPAPYMTGPAPTPPAQAFEPPAPPEPAPAPPAPPAPPEPPKAPAAPAQKGPFLGEITDQNYLTILGRALDLVGWSDEQADSFSVSRFKVPHWDELGRSQAEVLIEHLLTELQSQMSSEG